MKSQKARRAQIDVLQTLETMNASPDYYTQQNYQSQLTEKEKQ